MRCSRLRNGFQCVEYIGSFDDANREGTHYPCTHHKHDDDPGVVRFSQLTGLRVLSGIWRSVQGNQVCVVIRLDDVLYRFMEDPGDGLRSCLDYIEIADVAPTDFALIHPLMVVSIHTRCTHKRGEVYKPTCDKGGDDVLFAVDDKTGLVVLEIGTARHDYMYPTFLFSWVPHGWEPEWFQAIGEKSS